MDSLSLGMPARFQKCGEATFNYPYNNHSIGHDGRGIAVTIRRNVGHDAAESPVTMTWNTHSNMVEKPEQALRNGTIPASTQVTSLIQDYEY